MRDAWALARSAGSDWKSVAPWGDKVDGSAPAAPLQAHSNCPVRDQSAVTRVPEALRLSRLLDQPVFVYQ